MKASASLPNRTAQATGGRRQRIAGFAVFAIVILAPLAITYLTGERLPGGGWAVDAGIAMGFLAMALMSAQFATTGRFHRVARQIGQGTMMKFHRAAGIVALALVLLHPILLILAEPTYLEFLDPRVNLPRAAALITVTLAALGLVLLPLARKRIGLSYEWWRLSHGALAGLVIFIGIAHINMVAYYTGSTGKRALWIAVAGAAVGLLVQTRLVRPWRMRRRPWRVAEVRAEHEHVWTVVLEAEGHAGLPFKTGQHVWLTLGDTPFSLQQHPFTIASADSRPDRLELTIKELGDFTRTIGATRSGQRAYLEGPYGASWFHEADTAPFIFIAGGIGITPFASALRSMRSRGWTRDFVLLHGSHSLAKATFHEELTRLASELGGRYVPVIESPPEGWKGERGYITAEVLRRHLDADQLARGRFVLCGPPAMLSAVRRELRTTGVPGRRIHLEQFDMV